MVNSRRKGSRGELEFCRELKRFGVKAHRGQQFCGTPDSPDVVTNHQGVHYEVKRTETLSPYKALAQAESDCGESVPVVAHKRNRKPWVIIMLFDDWMRMLGFEEAGEEKGPAEGS